MIQEMRKILRLRMRGKFRITGVIKHLIRIRVIQMLIKADLRVLNSTLARPFIKEDGLIRNFR